jgi:hypothetical protein
MVEQIGTSEMVLMIALATNLGGLVWGAATIAAAVKQLRESVQDVTQLVKDHDRTIYKHETRITVLEKAS